MSGAAAGAARVRRIFHATAVVHDVHASVEQLERLLGATVLSRAEGEAFGVEMRRAMVWIGDNLVEVIEPVGESAFSGFLSRFGGGLNSLGLQVGDAAAAEKWLGAHGVEVAVRYGEDMFATRTGSTAGLALQFTSQWVHDDPRKGNAPPPPSESAIVTVDRLAFIAALVEEPVAAAGALAQLFGSTATILDVSSAPGPEAVVGIGDCTLALYRRAGAADGAAWGVPHERPRFLALGVHVSDADSAAAALEEHGATRVAQHAHGWLVELGPGGLPIIVGPALLPGDPRSG